MDGSRCFPARVRELEVKQNLLLSTSALPNRCRHAFKPFK